MALSCSSEFINAGMNLWVMNSEFTESRQGRRVRIVDETLKQKISLKKMQNNSRQGIIF